MSLAHLLGLDDGGERWLCTSCGRIVGIEADGDAGDRPSTDESDEVRACPNCGSQNVRRLALF